MSNEKILYVVHCVDTEGPLYESLEATFERLHSIFGIKIEPSLENLRKLQVQQIPLNGLEHQVALTFSPLLVEYNDTWDKIDFMLNEIMSEKYRLAFPDSFGRGWIFNWHCVAHVGYSTNPRRRDIGFHNIFDFYRSKLKEPTSSQDGLQFHFHPLPFSRQAHHSATHYFAHNDILFELLARRIIERRWFPAVNRAGFDTERPDSNWFLEQFIPFDFSNQAIDEEYSCQQDIAEGRFGDWRRAPRTWQPYHPGHDDYQVPGTCRRWISRCLKIGTRVRLLTQSEVDLAFAEAREGKPAVLACTDHDFRDMRPNIKSMHAMLLQAQKKMPVVKFRYCEVREAMRLALKLEPAPPLRINVDFRNGKLCVESDRPTFGPQPFLALKTSSGQFLHDNLDFQEPFRSWTYTFDEQTLPLPSVEQVGVAACDANGNTTVVNLDIGRQTSREVSF